MKLHILAAVGFRNSGHAVIARSVALAQTPGALLTVLHVIDGAGWVRVAAISADDLQAARALARQEPVHRIESAVIAGDPGRTNWVARVETRSPPTSSSSGAMNAVRGAKRSSA